MRKLLTAVFLAVMTGDVRVYGAGGEGYETLVDMYSSVQPGKYVAAAGLPEPGAAVAGSAVPGCPGLDAIRTDWREHTDPADIPARIKEHLGSSLVQSGPLLLPIHRVPYYLGVARRGDLIAQAYLEPGCQVTGTAAYYVIGEEGAPEINFDLIMDTPGQEAALEGRLVELRWFDLKDGRRHRWYNLKLAARRGWLVDEYGRPTPDYRPIGTFTNAVNELY